MKNATEAVYSHDSPNHSLGAESVKDPLSSANFLTVIEHLHDIMQALRLIYPEKDWHIKWQKLTRRYYMYTYISWGGSWINQSESFVIFPGLNLTNQICVVLWLGLTNQVALFFLSTSRSAFSFNPSLQTRSFLILGVISSHASANVVTKTLKVMEEVSRERVTLTMKNCMVLLWVYVLYCVHLYRL